ncbi:MAG TPA: hypothetical protein VF179_03195 [Thermoanaerobaculia bacterium]|nr:hypothetical protein [Thermoanaerobaculia bacterium]
MTLGFLQRVDLLPHALSTIRDVAGVVPLAYFIGLLVARNLRGEMALSTHAVVDAPAAPARRAVRNSAEATKQARYLTVRPFR